MAVSNKVAEAFLWGQGGAKMTPEQLAVMRDQQKNRKNGVDFSPVGHWTQGLGRVAEGVIGAFQRGQLADAEAANVAGSQDRMSSWFSPVADALSGGSPTVTAPVTPVVSPMRSESTEAAQGISPNAPLSQQPDIVGEVLEAGNAGSPVAGALVASAPQSGNWLSYANQGATRNKPINDKLAGAMSFLPELGVTMQVHSGGQDAKGQGSRRTGSTRHDHGNAADVDFYTADGRKLDWNNQSDIPLLSDIVARAKANGVTGFGAGNDYMGAGRMHIGFGNPGVWGAGGKGENAPSWLQSAFNGVKSTGSSVANALMPQSAPSPAPVQANMGGLGNINPQSVMQSLMSPYATQQERAGAQMMLGMYQQQQQQAAAQQQQQQALQQRQAIATQMGFDPAFANDEVAFKVMIEKANRDRQTATVGGNIVDPVTGQVIYSAPKDLPTSVQEYQFGLDNPGYFEQQERLKRSGSPQTNINNNMGGEKFSEEFGKNDAKLLADVDTAGIQAARNIARIDQLGSMLGNIETGGAASIKQFAGEWGINTEGLSDIQAAQALVNSLVPEQRQPGSGPMSDADLALFKQSLPRIINTPEGNRMIVDTMRGIAQYDAEGAAIVQQLRSGEIDRTTAFRMLRERQNPLAGFKGASPQKTQSGPSKISDKSQYDALPSGSEYIAPDGSTRRKP